MYQHQSKIIYRHDFHLYHLPNNKTPILIKSTFSIKYSTNSVGVYKRPDFGFGNDICLSTLSILTMGEAFMCRCFIILFDVVFRFLNLHF